MATIRRTGLNPQSTVTTTKNEDYQSTLTKVPTLKTKTKFFPINPYHVTGPEKIRKPPIF